MKKAARLGSGESDDVNSPLIPEGGSKGQIELVALRKQNHQTTKRPYDLENLSDPDDSLSQREGGDSESFSSESEDLCSLPSDTEDDNESSSEDS